MRRISKQDPHRRAGLAPLELVLNLPIMLMLMALMIIFGTAGAWKVRTLTNSRQAAWRAFETRTGNNDPNPPGWPDDAEMEIRDSAPPIMPADPYSDFAVVRGPVLSDGQSALPVDRRLLDTTSGIKSGFAEVDRQYPLWPTLPGRNHFARDHIVLDGTRFQYHSMGIPSNITRRVLFLYPFDLQAIAPMETARFVDAALAIVFNPLIPDLLPLTGGDPEVYELVGRRSPDFQPQLLRRPQDFRRTRAADTNTQVPTYCTLDVAQLRAERIDDQQTGLKRQIRDVPRRMANYYISVYQEVIDRYQTMMPPPPGAAVIIAEMERRIELLRNFLASLPQE